MEKTIRTARYEIRIRADPGPFRVEWRLESPAAGLELLHLRAEAGQPAAPPPLELVWLHPLAGTHHLWHPGVLYRRFLLPDFDPNVAASRGNCYAPVMTLFNGRGGERADLRPGRRAPCGIAQRGGERGDRERGMPRAAFRRAGPAGRGV